MAKLGAECLKLQIEFAIDVCWLQPPHGLAEIDEARLLRSRSLEIEVMISPKPRFPHRGNCRYAG